MSAVGQLSMKVLTRVRQKICHQKFHTCIFQLFLMRQSSCISINLSRFRNFINPEIEQVSINPCSPAQTERDTRSMFNPSKTCLDSSFFLSSKWSPKQGWRTLSTELFIHCWRKNRWIHTFPKGLAYNKFNVVKTRIKNLYPTANRHYFRY